MNNRERELKIMEERWCNGLASLFAPHSIRSSEWRTPDEIVEALSPIMGGSASYCMLPNEGHIDVLSIGRSLEHGFIEIQTDVNCFYLMKPKSLHFALIEEPPKDSFFLLRNDPLEKIFPDSPSSYAEDLVELAPQEYEKEEIRNHDVDRLPPEYRIIRRWFRGDFLIVCKAGLWNQLSLDGRYRGKSVEFIRETIIRGLANSSR